MRRSSLHWPRGRGKGVIEADGRDKLLRQSRSTEAHYQLGLISERQNQKAEAVREFQAALEINPQYTEARRELAKLNSPGQ